MTFLHRKLGTKRLPEGLSKFKGEVYVVVGSGNQALGKEVGYEFIRSVISSARHKELHEAPNCDHYFSGSKNSKIFSQAPVYAFSEEKTFKFPDYSKGVMLYK